MKYWLGSRPILGLLAGLVLTAPIQPAFAHEGLPPAPHDLWSAWNESPSLWLSLGLIGWVYTRGVVILWWRAGTGRGVSWWQVAAFSGGWIALFVALISPLDALSQALFSAHMVQHLILILIAAPLLTLGAPLISLAWAMPKSWCRESGRWWHRQTKLRLGWQAITQPLVVWLLHTAALWIWHAPALYQAALQNDLIHLLEHGSFFGSALLFWWTVVKAYQPRSGRGFEVLYLFTMTLQSGLLGALMTFSPTPWYSTYTKTAPPWNLTPLEDQQLAGVIMWLPAGVVYLVAALVLLGSWLSELASTSIKIERQDDVNLDLEKAKANTNHSL